MTSRLTTRLLATAALSFGPLPLVLAQTVPPCEVETAQEFLDALACIAANCSGTCAICPNGCPDWIVVPEDATILVGTSVPIETISIGSEHSDVDRPLKITIRGRIKWVGDPSSILLGYRIFRINGATHLTIDGENTGRIFSDLDPAIPANEYLPRAFRILAGSDIVIKNLDIDHLGYIADLGEDETRQTLSFINLRAEEMSEYGIYGNAHNVLIQDCRIGDPQDPSVTGTYYRHAYRLYGNRLTVRNCVAHNISNYALWPVSGEDDDSNPLDFTIDGFTANAALVFGPNESVGDSTASEHLWYTRIRDVEISFNPTEPDPNPPLQGMRAQLGV